MKVKINKSEIFEQAYFLRGFDRLCGYPEKEFSCYLSEAWKYGKFCLQKRIFNSKMIVIEN